LNNVSDLKLSKVGKGWICAKIAINEVGMYIQFV
jgi:hypothetical protein